ncbi:winged helix DNA-binding domain-containing protein [Kineosporia sp. R_H_3]|uniref:winged helix DNA-binding domain-containing protein n=1 Tax=Kineosporia sp. R_H_3 TaxID=1961848 RepID=UPI0018EA1A83|nr:winged helix DNA-binding domain-containing protein [Kineosporia sp. R_H_3]
MPAGPTPPDVHLQRLEVQGLTQRADRTPDDVVRRILAVQAQDLRGARLAVRSRSTGLLARDVDAAFDAGRLVVAWLNRGTLHLVAAEDYWWLHPLTTPQLATNSRRRLEQEGVSPAQLETGVDVVSRAVTAGPMSRDGLRTLLDDAGVPTKRQAFIHVLFAASLRGLLLRGPVLPGGEQAFVDPVTWLGPRPPDPDPDEALGQLARRYLVAHGPARDADLATWAGTTLGAARRGLAVLGSTADDDGLHRLPGAAAAAGAVPAPVLLGPFDPVLHGWVDREAVIGRHTGLVTSNGIFKASALVGGRAVGTWTLPGGRVTLDAFEPLTPDVVAALAEDARAVHHYLGLRDREMVVTGGRA